MYYRKNDSIFKDAVICVHPDTKRKLNFTVWEKAFYAKIGLEANPFFKKWFDPKFSELNTELETDASDDDRWKRVTAGLSICCDRFDLLELALPKKWISGTFPYLAKTFSLSDVITDFPVHKIDSWCKKFDEFEAGKMAWLKVGNQSEPWWLRKTLLDEYLNLYFGETKKLIGQSGPERNRKLRDLVFETMMYRESIPLANVFYRKVEEFVSGIKVKASDPMTDFVKRVLPALLGHQEDDLDRKSIVLDMLSGYWDQLKKTAKDAELVNIIQAEVSELISFLTETESVGKDNGHDD